MFACQKEGPKAKKKVCLPKRMPESQKQHVETKKHYRVQKSIPASQISLEKPTIIEVDEKSSR